jgi:hypothetical protein
MSLERIIFKFFDIKVLIHYKEVKYCKSQHIAYFSLSSALCIWVFTKLSTRFDVKSCISWGFGCPLSADIEVFDLRVVVRTERVLEY